MVIESKLDMSNSIGMDCIEKDQEICVSPGRYISRTHLIPRFTAPPTEIDHKNTIDRYRSPPLLLVIQVVSSCFHFVFGD